MSNIRYLEGQCDLFWNRVKDDFAGFERPRIFPASAIRRDAPMYMRRYIDADPNSFYMFLAGDPLKHQDISRDKACEFFDRFFYEHMRMPSSFDVEAGGEYSREQAIDKEVLPARDDSAYQTYAQEQEELARQWAEQQEQERNDAEDRWEQEHGFRRDDPDIIDVTDDSSTNTASSSSSRAVGQAAGTAVGMPKKIFYAVDFRISAGGNALGYDRGSNRLSGGRSSSGYLRESESDTDEILAQLAELMKKAKKGSDLQIELEKVYDKFAGVNEDEIDEDVEEETSECEKCGDDDCKAGEKCGMKESEDEVCEDDVDVYEDDEDVNEDEDLDESLVQYVNCLARERN